MDMDTIISNWVEREFDVIIGTSWEYQTPMTRIAAEALAANKTTKFAVLTGWEPAPNLMVTFSKLYQVKYLLGYLAGLMSKTGHQCYIGAVRDDPSLMAGAIAQAIGFADAYPGGHTHVYFINAWTDDILERKTAEQALHDHPEIDIFTTHTDSITTQLFAREKGLFSTGISSDMRFRVGESVLSSAIFKWETALADIVNRALTDTWIENYTAVIGMQEGGVALTTLSNFVPSDVAEEIYSREDRMLNDPHWDAFCSPNMSEYTDAPLDENGCVPSELISSFFSTVDHLPPSIATVYPDIVIPPIPIVWLEYNSGIAVAFMIIAALGMVMCVVLLVLLATWKNKHFKASSREFLAIIVIGTFMSQIAVFLIPGKPNPAQCQAFMWITGTAFVLVYGAILIKSFRIWIIFKRVAKLTDPPTMPLYLLFLVLLGMILTLFVILITWTAIDYPTVVLSENVLYPDSLVASCHWNHYRSWMGAFLGYMGLYVVCGSVISWLSRKIYIEVYNESQQLGLMMYNVLVVGTILVSLLQTIELSLEAQFALEAVLITWIGISGIVILFLPKLYGKIRNDKKTRQYPSSSPANTDSTSAVR
eukprot:TRINITY_DN411_c0_g1_i4.p1 TRINITY_DN411_c0_g1~~TRINITY_DN411_c0_g1_i4.p1  ORF type:complete len:592 (+),score=97.65 TRINITY_DN411_c0_g1_i4:394-2169(+)